jgi:hypothetical protein
MWLVLLFLGFSRLGCVCCSIVLEARVISYERNGKSRRRRRRRRKTFILCCLVKKKKKKKKEKKTEGGWVVTRNGHSNTCWVLFFWFGDWGCWALWILPCVSEE